MIPTEIMELAAAMYIASGIGTPDRSREFIRSHWQSMLENDAPEANEWIKRAYATHDVLVGRNYHVTEMPPV